MRELLIKSALVLFFVGAIQMWSAVESSTVSIKVVVEGLKNSNGVVRVALYNSKESYEKSKDKAFRSESVKITNNKAEVIFKDVPAGEYGIAILHDENGNGKMDRNFLGIPKEGFGFSNNPKILFGAPKFEEIKFEVKDVLKVLLIQMKYY